MKLPSFIENIIAGRIGILLAGILATATERIVSALAGQSALAVIYNNIVAQHPELAVSAPILQLVVLVVAFYIFGQLPISIRNKYGAVIQAMLNGIAKQLRIDVPPLDIDGKPLRVTEGVTGEIEKRVALAVSQDTGDAKQ